MAFLGRPPSTETSVNASVETFTGDGGVSFTLSRAVNSDNPSFLEVFVSNVQQQPNVSYTLSGSQLTFNAAPGNGEPIYVVFRDYNRFPRLTIPDLTVGTAAFESNAVTEAKIANTAITESKIADSAVTLDKILGTFAISKGGTGNTSFASDTILVSNATSVIEQVEPGAENNILIVGDNGWESGSLFGTIATPSVTPFGNSVPFVLTSVFNQTGNILTASHASTDWQIVRTSNSQIVFERIANTTNLVSITIPAGILEASVEYDFKAKHNTLYGNSAFGSNVYTVNTELPGALGSSYGGGFYIGTLSLSSTCYYLVMAPNATGCACCQWKNTNSFSSNVSSSDDGYANTYNGLANASHPAGNWTATRTIGGFSDWYLPARNELSILNTNKSSAPAGEGFPTTGGAAGSSYWSSSELNECSASSRIFSNGYQDSANKISSCRVRAVRRIPF